MLKKTILFLLMFCYGHSLTAELPISLTNQFKISQRWFSWTCDFDVKVDQIQVGRVQREFLALNLTYNFYDARDNLEARAEARFFEWGFTFDVSDAFGQPIGILSQKIFTFFPTYAILSPDGDVLAEATLNFWSTEFVLKDPITGQKIVTMRRPFLRFKDTWSVFINNPFLFSQKKMNPSLIILVAAFRTDYEQISNYKLRRLRERQYNYALTNQKLESNPLIGKLQNALDSHKNTLHLIESTETDFNKMETLTEEILKGQLLKEDQMHNYKLIGIQRLLPLLTSQQLTIGEKAALYQMMLNAVNDLNSPATLPLQ